jgi:hypothetical protein
MNFVVKIVRYLMSQSGVGVCESAIELRGVYLLRSV